MLVLIERCQNTETHSSLHMGLHGCREHLVSGCTMESRRAGRGRVIIWAMLCWETFGPAIHVDVMLTCTTYLSIIADHVHFSWKRYSLIAVASFNRLMHSATKTKRGGVYLASKFQIQLSICRMRWTSKYDPWKPHRGT